MSKAAKSLLSKVRLLVILTPLCLLLLLLYEFYLGHSSNIFSCARARGNMIVSNLKIESNLRQRAGGASFEFTVVLILLSQARAVQYVVLY